MKRETPRVPQARLSYGEPLAEAESQRLKCRCIWGQFGLAPLVGTGASSPRVVESVPRNDGPTVILLGALGLTGLDAPMTVAGVTDGEGLHALVEQVLGATLWPGDIVLIDNLGAHKVAGIQEAVARTV